MARGKVMLNVTAPKIMNWILPYYTVNFHLTKALSSLASLRSHPRHFIYFSRFLNSLSPWVRLAGGKGAELSDMNRPSPRRVLVGSSHGSEVPWHTRCTQRSHCQRNLSRFGWFFWLLLLLLLIKEFKFKPESFAVSFHRLLHVRLLQHVVQPEAQSILGAAVSSLGGRSHKCLFKFFD